MSYTKRALIATMILFLLIPGFLPLKEAEASTLSSYQTFNQNLSKELNLYIKKSGSNITLHYRDFSNGDEFKINSTSAKKAASTIKLPLALFIMELAAAKKINLNEKLTYKRHHYYGGSGVIQKQKVGTTYTIRDLVNKAMVHSDNIAFIMLREKVGKNNFIAYMKKIGGKNAYPKGQNLTSSTDLIVYAHRLYNFSRTNALGKELVEYLKRTDYNTTIPKGTQGIPTAHKVGMIPMSKIYNDIGIVYDKNPFALAIMTNNISYAKSQKVIADISAIVYKHHKVKSNVTYFTAKNAAYVYKITSGKQTGAGTISKGETFKISSDKGDWYEIQFGNEKGYVLKMDTHSYVKPPSGVFSNGKIKNNGFVTAIGTIKLLTSPIANGKVIAVMNKGNSLYIHSMNGDYYTTVVGDRVGFVHKNSVQLQDTAAIKYIEIKMENTPFYVLQNGKYVQFGRIKKGQIFPRIREAGIYSEVQFGTEKAYIAKADSNPLFSAQITNPAENRPAVGKVLINQEVTVFNKPSENAADVIGTILTGQNLSYVKLENNWYEINFLGRKAYVQKLEEAVRTED